MRNAEYAAEATRTRISQMILSAWERKLGGKDGKTPEADGR